VADRETASSDEEPDPQHDAFASPSQLLTVEVLRRPLEFTQYTSIAFGLHCRAAGVRPSMGSVGDAYDNALCESFFATLECELLDRRPLRTQAEAQLAVFEFIEGWYNPHRRHSALGYLSPIDFEKRRAEDGKSRGSAPAPPRTIERRGDQEGPGLESGKPSTETG
jgi:putative transposase